MDQPVCLAKITSVRGQDYPIQKSQASKAPIRLLSNRSDNKDYTNPLRSNKPRPFEALTRPETSVKLATLTRPSQTLPFVSQDPGINRYS